MWVAINWYLVLRYCFLLTLIDETGNLEGGARIRCHLCWLIKRETWNSSCQFTFLRSDHFGEHKQVLTCLDADRVWAVKVVFFPHLMVFDIPYSCWFSSPIVGFSPLMVFITYAYYALQCIMPNVVYHPCCWLSLLLELSPYSCCFLSPVHHFGGWGHPTSLISSPMELEYHHPSRSAKNRLTTNHIWWYPEIRGEMKNPRFSQGNHRFPLVSKLTGQKSHGVDAHVDQDRIYNPANHINMCSTQSGSAATMRGVLVGRESFPNHVIWGIITRLTGGWWLQPDWQTWLVVRWNRSRLVARARQGSQGRDQRKSTSMFFFFSHT